MTGMPLLLRKARPEDKPKVLDVESKSTPSLRYLPHVYDDWISEELGDMSVVELDGEIIGCGKYSRLPDGSAWLEALRVTPARQGLGGGKILYEHWLDLARKQGVAKLRMYTGVSNVVSKGLAERYGLRVEGTYREATMSLTDTEPSQGAPAFRQVRDAKRATELVMALSEEWRGFHVMNRTFYGFSPALCAHLAENGMVYEDAKTGSMVTLGARFMPWQALNVGVLGGDHEACLRFALRTGLDRKVERLNILYPPEASDVHESLTRFGFKVTPGDFITMGISLKA